MVSPAILHGWNLQCTVRVMVINVMSRISVSYLLNDVYSIAGFFKRFLATVKYD